MIHFNSVLSTVVLAAVASARITGIAVPSEIEAGKDFNVTFLTENYIQSVADISAAFGVYGNAYPGSVGSSAGSAYLGPDKSNVIHNFTACANLPTIYPVGSDANFSVAITSLYGILGQPTTTIYRVPITFANNTNNEMVWTYNGTNACPRVESSSTTTTTTPPSSAPSSTHAKGASSTETPMRANSGNVDTMIHDLQQSLNVLMNNIIQSDWSSARLNYNNMSSTYDHIQEEIDPNNSSCPDAGPGHQIMQGEALQLIQTIQEILSEVSQDMTNADGPSAHAKACNASAMYFNSGLHEFVFANQASGTGM